MRFAKSTQILLLGCLLLGGGARLCAQEVVADPNPQLFAVLAAINLAGYDAGMEKPELVPLRVAIREELAQRTASILPDLQEFYRSHRLDDPDQDLSQYVSLALFLSPPPEFQLPQNPANLPLEVWDLRDMAPLLATFYREADLASLWEKYLPAMEQESDRYRRILAQVIQETNAHLRMDASGSGNRRFAIYISPLGAPNQTNARSYGENYFLVFGPSVESPEEDIRHGWLHYLLDPYPYRNVRLVDSKSELHRIAPRAPALDTALRGNFSLLLTESLIRAIQARRIKGDAETRRRAAEDAVAEGFYLTAYFFDAMAKFEEQPVGMSLYYSEMIEAIPVRDEQRRLASVQFRTSPSRLRAEAQWNSLEELTQMGERSIARGQYEEARQVFETVSKQYGPQPRVLYGLALVASQQKQPERAKEFFSAAASLSTDARLKAWSHIYLGRLLDLEGNRPAAQAEYQAALAAGDPGADTREAAEKGLHSAFVSQGGIAPPSGNSPPENRTRPRVPLGREDR